MSTAVTDRRDFWFFFAGQSVSNLGSAITFFAIPLLVYELTGSAVNLGATAAAEALPFLFFGLVIGAWVDRVDRKRLMIVTDLVRGLLLLSLPLADRFGTLSVWQIYAVAFLTSTLTIAFDSAQFAAIPSLVSADDLISANGRIQASYSAARLGGPLLAGVMIGATSTSTVILLDALTYAVSACSLLAIRQSFNAGSTGERRGNLRQDILEGLRFVWRHPVLRTISIMMLLINGVTTTVQDQYVLFAHERFDVSDRQLGLLFSAGSAGVMLFSLLAGPLRRRLRFGPVALGSLMISGALIVLSTVTPTFWSLVLIEACASGLATLFNINTGSLRQQIVPNVLLGRIMSIAMVLAVAAQPVGSLSGGWLVERTGDVRAIYAGIGVLTMVIAFGFWFSPLGRAERYLERPATPGSTASVQPTMATD